MRYQHIFDETKIIAVEFVLNTPPMLKSSVVDRIVYGDQEVKWKEEEIIRRVNAGFENLKWNVGCSDGFESLDFMNDSRFLDTKSFPNSI